MSYTAIDLLPETKQAFAYFPRLKQLWQDNIEPPIIASRKPRVVQYFMDDSFIPTFLFIDGQLVKYEAPKASLHYALLIVCDDIPVSLSVGSQSIFDYTDQVDLPDFLLTKQENLLQELESQLKLALAQQKVA